MHLRDFGNTGEKISNLGFGAMRLPTVEVDGEKTFDVEESIRMIHRGFELGINYIDTAWGYCDRQSQTIVGKALKGWRDRVSVSTKLPTWQVKTTDDFRIFLDKQLEELAVDRIDFFHFHGLSVKQLDEVVRPLKLLDEMHRAKADGLIAHLSFSSHDTPDNIIRLIDLGFAESLLCQYNLLDQKNAPALAHARAKGLGTVVMGPIGGGRLGVPSPKLQALIPGGVKSTPEIALRFVLPNPDVCCALSGMSTMTHVEENCAIADREALLGEAELTQVREAMAESQRLMDLYCTGCNYCLPCPQGVKIPRNFHLYNLHRVYGLDDPARKYYEELKSEMKASACVNCGACEPKCPQNIEIRRQLKEVAEYFERA